MDRTWRLQFGLRTLLLAMFVFAISLGLVLRYRQWREDQVWEKLESARSFRNAALVRWRRIYELNQKGELRDEEESDARELYFHRRAIVATASREVQAFYGKDVDALKAAHAMRTAKQQHRDRAR